MICTLLRIQIFPHLVKNFFKFNTGVKLINNIVRVGNSGAQQSVSIIYIHFSILSDSFPL